MKMQNFEIYVYEDMDEFDYLSCRIEKLRLWVAAVKIGRYFYQVNFYHKEIVYRYFNTEGNYHYSLPGLIIVDSIEIEELNKAVAHLINRKFFDSQKKYRSFDAIYKGDLPNYRGKPLSSIRVLSRNPEENV